MGDVVFDSARVSGNEKTRTEKGYQMTQAENEYRRSAGARVSRLFITGSQKRSDVIKSGQIKIRVRNPFPLATAAGPSSVVWYASVGVGFGLRQLLLEQLVIPTALLHSSHSLHLYIHR